ncbi:methionine biosynthesis protein MetW [bacterium]|nr:methionine biosynthesis protein MetW [Candidatus Brocadiia bacterium]NQT52062.1 methionine biosynthesis protein MetW [bacterium]
MRPDLLRIAELIEPGTRVLDLGCGSGELLRYLEDTRGVTARGIEIEPTRVMDCVAKGLSVCQGDIDEGVLDYSDNHFDYVVLSQTLHLVSRPRLVVREMLRVGRHGIVSIPNFGYWPIRLALLLRGRLPRLGCFKRPWYDTPTGHVMTLNDFRHFCRNNGIAIESQRRVASPGFLAEHRARLFPNLFAQLGIYLVTRAAPAPTP